LSRAPQSSHPAFVHPIEETFARILDYYGVEWVYEPQTFPLEWDDQGNVSVAFTPDFYLPQQDLYIELTTLRPSLIRYKNRKLRRMAELYPQINIKLLKRQDLRDMMLKFGLDEEAAALIGTGAHSDADV
jgi:hypoxanthine phosphoribosyltransferase